MAEPPKDKFIPQSSLNDLDQMSKDIAKSLIGNLAQRFKTDIAQGIQHGKSSTQIGNDLQAKYSDFKDKTSQSIVARTLLHAAYSKGALHDTIDDPNIIAYEFHNPNDNRSTKICSHLAGKIIKKEDIAQYIPPLHWGCRSVLIPVYATDGINAKKVLTPKVENTNKFKENVTSQIDPDFTNYMNFGKTISDAQNKPETVLDTEAVKSKTNLALEHLRGNIDTERLPGNTTGANDYIAKEVISEIAKREVPASDIPNTESYLQTEPEIQKLYNAYGKNRLKDALYPKNPKKIIEATDRISRGILENESSLKYNGAANQDEMIDDFLNNNGGGILPEGLKTQIRDTIKKYAWDPTFFSLKFAELRRKLEPFMAQQVDYNALDEDTQNLFDQYLTTFFQSIRRGANVELKNTGNLDGEILRLITSHPEYRGILDKLYGNIFLFQDTARQAILKRLDVAAAGVTSNPFEQNAIKNKIKLADFHVQMDDSLKTVNNIKEKINGKRDINDLPAEKVSPEMLLPPHKESKYTSKEYVNLFLKEFETSIENPIIYNDITGTDLKISDRFFEDRDPSLNKKEYKVKKRRREEYLKVFANTIKQPDEIWNGITKMDNKIIPQRKYIKVFENSNNKEAAVIIFELHNNEWTGVTAYQSNLKHIDGKRNGKLIYQK